MSKRRELERKILWVDLETTGTNPEKHAIIQIAALVDSGNEILGKFNQELAPHEGALITAEALVIQNTTVADIKNRPDPRVVYHTFLEFMEAFIDKFNYKDKFVIAGYNVSFDVQFLRSFFTRQGDKFFGSWFWWPALDVASFVAKYMSETSFIPQNFKLETLCNHFGLPLKAHDALQDIWATRELYHRLTGGIK
jgi:DNA polymerase III epsilon subunit-like protein